MSTTAGENIRPPNNCRADSRRWSAAQGILLAGFGGFCWLGMQAVHEAGHVLAALITGGEVVRVVLHPLVISRTGVYPNPAPLIVVWAGPLFGVLLPLLVFIIARAARLPGTYLARAFAGFCLIANGAYIGAAMTVPAADAADLLEHGAAAYQLLLFSVIAVSGGLSLWNGQGWRFGFGPARGSVSRRAAVFSLVLFLLTAGFGLFIEHIQTKQ